MKRSQHLESTVRRLHRIAARCIGLVGWMTGDTCRHRKFSLWPLFMMIVPIALSAFACSDGGNTSAAKAASAKESWAIHVYVETANAKTRLDLGPVKEISGTQNTTGTSAAAALKSGLRPQAGVEIGGTPVDIPLEKATDGAADGWGLVWAAAAECGRRTQLPPSLKDGRWGIFPYHPNSCDAALRNEESLLCIANKLAEVADTIKPITWTAPAEFTESPPKPEFIGTWVIPPQSERDKFIVRDLAIAMLAELAMNDETPRALKPPTSGDYLSESFPTYYYEYGRTCSEIYAGLADDRQLWTERSNIVFGYDLMGAAGQAPSPAPIYMPPEGIYPFALGQPVADHVPHAGVGALAQARLTHEAHILRAAGRLLYDLIRTSVYADLAGAERRRAHASDVSLGADAAWGEDDRYNSLAHAARVLMGRWELAFIAPLDPVYTLGDPVCGGLPLDLLHNAMGNDQSARRQDKPIATAEQANAVAFVEQSGVVVPGPALASALPALLKDIVRGQLAKKSAQTLNITVSQYEASPSYKELSDAIAAISDRDLQFALQRNTRSWRALNSQGDAVTTAQTPARNIATEALSAPAGAFAVLNGFSRTILSSDAVALAGGMIEASQCNEPAGSNGGGQTGVSLAADPAEGKWSVWTALGADPGEWPQPSGQKNLPPLGLSPLRQAVAYQDSFSLAQVLARRLVMIGGRLRASSLGTNLRTEDVAREAAAELEAWAGPGRVVSFVEGNAHALANLHIDMLGFEPNDFGVASAAEIPNQVELVYGPPWMAECAAKIGIGCPPGFDAAYAVQPSWSQVNPAPTELAKRYGVAGSYVRLKFDASRWDAKVADAGLVGNEHFYVIAKRDPLAVGAHGRVLGSIALRTGDLLSATVSTSFVVSRMQRELLAAIITGWKGSLSEPASYCVEGVPRDVVAPLENELTSDSDGYENSWKHYLTLAKQAADRADSLGQQMIEYGTQQELRREAAGEELADICGEGASLNAVTTDPTTGDVKAGPEDAALEFCISPPKHDLVFLTDDPRKKNPENGQTMSAEQARTHILDSLGCTSSDANYPRSRLCSVYEVPANPAIHLNFDDNGPIASLNLAEPTAPPPKIDECVTYMNAARTLRNSKFNAGMFAGAVDRPWASDAEIANTVQQYRVDVALDSEWTVSNGGFTIMESRPGKAWPGCLRPGSPGCDWENNKPAEIFNELYRWCSGTDHHAAIGGCGNGGGGDSERAELNTLLWRVKGSLWLLGAMSGRIPQGMFRIPLPAVNWDAWGTNVPHVAPVAMVYGVGRYAPDGTLLDRAPDETAAFSGAQPINLNFTRHGAHVGNELPPWIRGAYDASTVARYMHLTGANPDGTMDMNGISYFFRTYSGQAGVAGDKLDIGTRKRLAWGLDTMLCSTPHGPAADAGQWAPGLAQQVIAATKTALRTDSPMRKRFSVSEAGDGLWGAWFCWAGGDRIGDCGPFDNRYYNERPQADWWQLPAYRFYMNNPGVIAPVDDWDQSTWGADGYHDGIVVRGGDGAATFTSRDERVFAFANSGSPNGDCGAASQVLQAHAMACVAAVNGGVAFSDPPASIRNESDLAQLEQFLLTKSIEGRKALSKVPVENIPKRVVQDIRKGTITPGGVTGQTGQAVLELETALRVIPDSWKRFTTGLDKLANAIHLARNAIAAAKIDKTREEIQFDTARFQALISIAQGASKVGTGIAGAMTVVDSASGASSVAEGASLMAQGALQLSMLPRSTANADDKLANAIERAVIDLTTATTLINDEMLGALADVRGAVSKVKIQAAQIDALSAKAKYQAAKGTGQDFYQTPSGKVQPIPVNTVLSRMYGTTELRYKRALRDAKAMAYLARRAIEQRLGVRLTDIVTPVGPLDAPHGWADDLCSLVGIDYNNLRSAPGPDAGTNEMRADINRELMSEFSDAYIGDYVDKLANFVEYYNVQFPSHDADDIAVLSLKDDLLGAQRSCFVDAPNRLYYSGQLDAVGKGSSLQKGWRLSDCPSGTNCLSLTPGSYLAGNQAGPPDVARSQATWLHDRLPYTPAAVGPGGYPIGGKGIPLPTTPGPAGYVWQEVALDPGQYALSWWDQARAADGSLTATGPSDVPVPYRVTIFDSGFQPVTAYSAPPAGTLNGSAAWSPRRRLDFRVSDASKYYVAFAASEAGALGSVAIANVQLEPVSTQGDSTTYIATDSSRRVPSNECKSTTSEVMRDAFERRCDGGGCFYELKAPFLIDTLNLNERESALNGKLAKGNFNFRTISTALNLVGTGLRDCTGSTSPACYGTGFVEYTLTHNATQVGLLDWSGDETLFDFGYAKIEHAKAIAAERFMTVPLGQVDLGLLGQTGIEKPELRGRPIDGNYGLRIHDSAALKWDRLEDIQLITKYRYWSKIERKAPPSR